MNTPHMPGVRANDDQVWALSFRGQFTSIDGVHRARPLARHRLRDERQRYRRQREGQRERRSMTPAGRVF